MTTTSPGRDSLYSKLREVLGPEDAHTMIEMFRPEDDQLATKADLNDLSTRIDGLDQRMGRLEENMEKFDGRLWDFHSALRAQTRVFATIVVTAMLGIGSLSFAAAALL